MKIQISLMLFALFSIMLFVGSIDYADALKAKGTGLAPKSFGKATAGIVCGDKLCSEIPFYSQQVEKISKKHHHPQLISDIPVVELSNNSTFELSAGMMTNTIDGENLEMYGYNGQTPGPLFKVKQGDIVTVQFTNNIDFPTTVHWHGLRLDYTSDGVPGITQDPIQPGDSFEYNLKFPDEGIFLYHPHVRTEMQMEKGLYGNILVESDKSPQADYKIPLILDDISIVDGSLEKFESEMTTKTLMGRFGNTMLINGNADYSLEVKQGDIARFYLTNTANTRTFDFGIDQYTMKLVGDDASNYEKETIVDSVIIASSERRTVDVLFENTGEFDIIHSTPEKTYVLGRVIVSPSSTMVNNSDFYNTSENVEIIQEIEPFRKFFSVEPDLELEFDLKMTMTDAMVMEDNDHSEMSDHGNMSMDKHESKLKPIEWEDEMPQMNAMSNDENTNWILHDVKTSKEGFDIDYQANVGDIKKIRLVNSPDSAHPMQHPIHLHGQRFLVLNENGVLNENLAWKDSVLVPTGSTVDILVEFSNPGQWALHCHILEHAEAGMITEITVNP